MPRRRISIDGKLLTNAEKQARYRAKLAKEQQEREAIARAEQCRVKALELQAETVVFGVAYKLLEFHPAFLDKLGIPLGNTPEEAQEVRKLARVFAEKKYNNRRLLRDITARIGESQW